MPLITRNFNQHVLYNINIVFLTEKHRLLILFYKKNQFRAPNNNNINTLMKSMASLHQGPKVSNAKPLNT
jgi:hypothetical protein